MKLFPHYLYTPGQHWDQRTRKFHHKYCKNNTLLLYKKKKIVKSRSIIWSIEWWIVENGLAAILTPKSNSAFYPYYGRTLLDRNTSAIVKLMDAILGCMENEPASLDRMYLADVCWPPPPSESKANAIATTTSFLPVAKERQVGNFVVLRITINCVFTLMWCCWDSCPLLQSLNDLKWDFM